jgi:HlyD family secretion protein
MENNVKSTLEKKKKKSRLLLYIIIAVVVGLIAWFFISKKMGGELLFDTEKVSKGDITAIVSTTGNLSPVTTVDVGSEVSGSIQTLHADFNDHVKEGQILAQIDPSVYTTQLDQANARLKSAMADADSARADKDKSNIGIQQSQAEVFQAMAGVDKARADVENALAQYISAQAASRKADAQLKNDQAEYKRSEELYKRELISISEKDKAYTTYMVSKAASESAKAGINSGKANLHASQSNLESAKSNLKAAYTKKQAAEATARASEARLASAMANIQQMQGSVDTIKVNLRKCTIRSPIDGIIIARKVEVGQTVAASFQAPLLFQLAQNLKDMEVSASVDEADIGRVSAGQKVNFTVDAFPDDKFEGEIQQVRQSPKTEQNVVTYEVIITTENKDLKLKPGMTANIEITVETKKDVLRLPNAALRFRPDRYPSFPYPEDVKKEMEAKKKGNGKGGAQKDLKNDQSKKAEGTGGGKSGRSGRSRRGGRGKGSEKGGAEKKTVQIWVLEKNKPRRLKIETGITDNNYTEVKSGDLKDGMEVITDAYTQKEKKDKEKNSGGQMRVRF